MMTTRQQMIALLNGELPDALPFAPRLDLWYAAAQACDRLPAEYKKASLEEICKTEGWGIYRLTGDYRYLETKTEDWPFTCLGLYSPPETVYDMAFDDTVNLVSSLKDGVMDLKFETAKGDITTTLVLNNDMKKEGVTYPWIKEKLIKEDKDWERVALLFQALKLTPRYDSFLEMEKCIGESGLVASQATDAGSPVHLIQKNLINPTTFFTLYKEDRRRIDELAESIALYFDQVIDIYDNFPGLALAWGSNYDRTITFPPYFEKDILPWHLKVRDRLQPKGKKILTHTDGENSGLMELIIQSGVDGCESLCPYPMTRLKLHEYRAMWKDQVLIGGIPAEYLIADNSSEKEMIDYLDYAFKAMAPGHRFIPGVTDGVSPLSDFDRIRKMGAYFAEKGQLPLDGSDFTDIFAHVDGQDTGPGDLAQEEGILKEVQQAVIEGDKDAGIQERVQAALDAGLAAGNILEQGMISAMNYVGDGFAAGRFFIPEMLLAAQTMEAGVEILKPHLLANAASDTTGKIILGTVEGDLHDIGKNLVAIMLKGVGFQVIDLGINVSAEDFIQAIQEHRPDILALSALLTTTMPQMRKTLDAVAEAGLRDQLKIIVGGAPVTQDFANQIGADGYADTAGGAARIVNQLMG